MSDREELLEKIRRLEMENNKLAKELYLKREGELRERGVVSTEIAIKYGMKLFGRQNTGCDCKEISMNGEQLRQLSAIVRRALFGNTSNYIREQGVNKVKLESYGVKRTFELLDEEYEKYLKVMDQILGILYENRKKEANA